jgi:hypothetical protein
MGRDNGTAQEGAAMFLDVIVKGVVYSDQQQTWPFSGWREPVYINPGQVAFIDHGNRVHMSDGTLFILKDEDVPRLIDALNR